MTLPSVTRAQGYCPRCDPAVHTTRAVAHLGNRIAFEKKSPSPRAERSRRVFAIGPDPATRCICCEQISRVRDRCMRSLDHAARITPSTPGSEPTHVVRALSLQVPAAAIGFRQMHRVRAPVRPPSPFWPSASGRRAAYTPSAPALSAPRPRPGAAWCRRPPRPRRLRPADAPRPRPATASQNSATSFSSAYVSARSRVVPVPQRLLPADEFKSQSRRRLQRPGGQTLSVSIQ